MSRSQKRSSKDNYQGLNIRRLHRSELDDTTMRDLGRYDTRLDHNLRTVDKAKEVMLKSLESDKKIFLRGGIRSNKGYTTQFTNPGDSRKKRDNGAGVQTTKYLSDNRSRKSSLTGNQISAGQQHNANYSGNDVIAGAGSGGVGRQNRDYYDNVNNNTSSNNSNNNNSSSNSGGGASSSRHQQQQNRDILTETRDVIEKQKKGDALVEEYFSNYSTSHESRNSLPSSYDVAGYSHSSTPTIKMDDYLGPRPENIDYNPTNGKMATNGSQQGVYYEEYGLSGRRSDLWDYLSTPKNPSRNLQKREQLEREFSSQALKSRATTPAAGKSAKGSRNQGTSGLTPVGSSSLSSSTSAARKSANKSGRPKQPSPVPAQQTKAKSPTKGK